MASTMTAAQVVAAYGAYYQNRGQNRNSLANVLYRGSMTDQAFSSRVTTDTKIELGESAFNRILQPFQKQFTPIGDLVFKPHTLQLYRLKADFEFWPDDLVETWLGFLTDTAEEDRKKWPLVRWFIEVHYKNQIDEDYETNEIFDGVYAAPTPGTAGAAGTSMNGIKKIRADHITAGDITPIVVGAVPTDPATFVTYIETFCKSVDKKYWKMGMVLNMSEDLELRFREGMDAKYNTNYAQESNRTKVRNFNVTVRGLESHNGSTIIWMTPAWNAMVYTRRNGDIPRVENDIRLVQIYWDFWKGIGFWLPQLVYTNDVELPV